MDSFSGSDSLRALCAPFCCCFSQRLALSPSNESLNQLARGEDADAARTRSGEPGFEAAAHSDDHAAYEARRGSSSGPACEQQAGVVHLGAHATASRSRQRRRGGDISGGGTDTGSGLTRWTLFRSWLRGGQGAVQLPPDSEDEAENGINSRSSSSTRFLGRTYGDEDAAPIALDDVSLPPAPPFAATLSSQYSSGGPPSSSDQTTSDGRSALDAEAASEREARRQRRRIRRQARELGLSPEEYIERVNNGVLSVTAATEATRYTRDDVAQTRSHASTESSGSRRSRTAAASATDPPVSADGAYPETTTSSSSSSRRRRRHGHRSQLSVSSHSNTVSSSSSSKRSDRQRRHARGAEEETTPARSPLESPDDRFFEDEHGQLHALERGDGGTVSYDHIGVLPGVRSSVADDA